MSVGLYSRVYMRLRILTWWFPTTRWCVLNSVACYFYISIVNVVAGQHVSGQCFYICELTFDAFPFSSLHATVCFWSASVSVCLSVFIYAYILTFA